MVEIKAFFLWGEATSGEAYKFCVEFMKGIKTTSDRTERIAIVNKSHLRGITFEELEKEVLNYER